MTKAFAYLRVSGKGQIDGDGFDRQLLAIQSYASLNNFEIVEVFREEGVSGVTELEDRPALSELFAALEENGVRAVLIEKLDRIARDLMIQESIIRDMQKSGFILISVMEPDLCSSDPSRVMMRQIFGAVAQYEKSMIVLKLRGARQRKRIKNGIEKGYALEDASRFGKNEGRKAFGERPEEQDILHQIRRLSVNYNSRGIADYFNDRNIPSRSGKRWRPSVIAKILARDKKTPAPVAS